MVFRSYTLNPVFYHVHSGGLEQGKATQVIQIHHYYIYSARYITTKPRYYTPVNVGERITHSFS